MSSVPALTCEQYSFANFTDGDSDSFLDDSVDVYVDEDVPCIIWKNKEV